MNTQTNESPADDRFANVAVQLDELLERGEISPEAFALYAAMADAACSAPQPRATRRSTSFTTHIPTRLPAPCPSEPAPSGLNGSLPGPALICTGD